MTQRDKTAAKMERLREAAVRDDIRKEVRIASLEHQVSTLRGKLARATDQWKAFAKENRTLRAEIEIMRRRVPAVEPRGEIE